MIVVEPVPVHPTAVLTRGNFRRGDDAVIDGFRAITDACHAEGAVMVQQLYHVGQHGDFDNSFRPSWSPSGLPSFHDAEGSHAMTGRRDRGGDRRLRRRRRARPRRRLRRRRDLRRLPRPRRPVLAAVVEPSRRPLGCVVRGPDALLGRDPRAASGTPSATDFVIGLAVSADPVDGRRCSTLDELCEIVAWHDERGLMDYVTCGTGSYFNFAEIMPDPPVRATARRGRGRGAEARSCVTPRVQAESHIRTAANAEDVIAVGRRRHGVDRPRPDRRPAPRRQGAGAAGPHDVRTCISCNQMCWGRRSRDYWISCLVNPSAGREVEWGGDRFAAADDPAASAGHRRRPRPVSRPPASPPNAATEVTLVEAPSRLGGAFRLAGQQPRRGQILDLLAWYERQLDQLGVDVRLGVPLRRRAGDRRRRRPVVVATGSRPAGTGFQRRLAGAGRAAWRRAVGVVAVEDVLDGHGRRRPPGRGARRHGRLARWWHGAGTWPSTGHDVVIVTGYPHGRGVHPAHGRRRSRCAPGLAALGVPWHTETVVTAWTGDACTRAQPAGRPDQRPSRPTRWCWPRPTSPTIALADGLVAGGRPTARRRRRRRRPPRRPRHLRGRPWRRPSDRSHRGDLPQRRRSPTGALDRPCRSARAPASGPHRRGRRGHLADRRLARHARAARLRRTGPTAGDA